jgi:long-subunit acyl-CoA synthetase (AMP-forming)
VVVSEPSRDRGESDTFRALRNEKWDADEFFGGAKMLSSLITVGLKRGGGSHPCIGVRATEKEFTWQTYEQVHNRIDSLAAAFTTELKCSQGDMACFFLQNCAEWSLLEHASYASGVIVVPLYETLGKDSAAFILNQTQARVLIVDANSLAKVEFAKCPKIAHVILVGKHADTNCIPSGVVAHKLSDLEKKYQGHNRPILAGSDEDSGGKRIFVGFFF